jgi:TDG/mug DNA glycosylase family protein
MDHEPDPVMSLRYRGLAPVTGKNPRVLVLGSFPGRRSLAEQEYYANPQNHFWRIAEFIFGIPRDLPYPDRVVLLTEQGVALWDVIQSCARTGSADDRIRDPVFNDLPGFIAGYPSLGLVALNGTTAGRYYTRIESDSRIRSVILPSTSPANARFSIQEKINRWECIRTPDSLK